MRFLVALAHSENKYTVPVPSRVFLQEQYPWPAVPCDFGLPPRCREKSQRACQGQFQSVLQTDSARSPRAVRERCATRLPDESRVSSQSHRQSASTVAMCLCCASERPRCRFVAAFAAWRISMRDKCRAAPPFSVCGVRRHSRRGACRSSPSSSFPDRAILQKIFQLGHEFLHVFEIHINAGEAYVRNLVQLLQAMHDHLANFRGRQFALRSLVHHAFNLIHDSFQFRRGHRPFFAGFEQSLQNLLPLEALAASILLDDYVRNFVDTFISREAAGAFQAFAATANGISRSAFARIDYLVIEMRTERTFHSGHSPVGGRISDIRDHRLTLDFADCGASCGACAMIAVSISSSSCSRIRRSSPSERPSFSSSGTPASEQAAKVTNQRTIAAATADSCPTPYKRVNATMDRACDPPPTPGSCTAEPTKVKTRTRM